jgi:hypothetical protein
MCGRKAQRVGIDCSRGWSMMKLFRLGAAAAALLSMMLAPSPSLGDEVPGRWQIREPSGVTFLQFVHPAGEVYLTLFCPNKGRTLVEVNTLVGTALASAGQTARLTLKLPAGDYVTLDAKLDKNGEHITGQIGLHAVGPLLVHADRGPLAVEVLGAEALLNVNKLGPLAERFVDRCN